jgi:hypothetical protein
MEMDRIHKPKMEEATTAITNRISGEVAIIR